MGHMLGAGVYSFAEAARLTGLRPGRIRDWFQRSTKKGKTFKSDYEPIAGSYAISFHDLVDVRLAAELRRLKIPMQSVRRFYANLQRLLDESHPFAHQALLTDGKSLFLNAFDDDGGEHVTDIDTLQEAFPTVVLPLLEPLDFDAKTHLATRWHIATGVVVDPELNLGKPVIEDGAISTFVLAQAYAANDRDAEAVAEWYDVTPDQVNKAVAFESSLR